jgi:septum formation protein
MEAPTPTLILASASPRRRSLLAEAGYEFTVQPANINETDLEHPKALPGELALRLALVKADFIADKHPNDVVLGADTLVAFGDQVLGKPRDAEHARWMLNLLAGTTHLVITGVCVMCISNGHRGTARVMSAVQMKPLTVQQINRYVESDLWKGKAGGYGIQDNDPFVSRLSGCHTNIVGLPMTHTERLLRAAGIQKNAAAG